MAAAFDLLLLLPAAEGLDFDRGCSDVDKEDEVSLYHHGINNLKKKGIKGSLIHRPHSQFFNITHCEERFSMCKTLKLGTGPCPLDEDKYKGRL